MSQGVSHSLAGSFGWIDWSVVAALFLVTHFIGRAASGTPATIRDFFLGGRRLPWYAVSASIIATEISAVTLISLPAAVFKPGGDITYLQLGLIGLFLARWIVALYLIPAYYEREIYSPYDYVGNVLGEPARRATTVLFSIGGVLGQSARVYLTGIVLEIVLHDQFQWLEAHTGIPGLWVAIALIGAVAVTWTWLGGMTTVIWTDAVLFLIFLVAIVGALVTAALHVEGGAREIVRLGEEAGKFRLFDFEASLLKPYTIWAALIANTWVGVGAFGTDQLMAQRMFCCRDARAAKKALLVSYASMIVAVLVALVGVALYAYYQHHPLTGRSLELVGEKTDRVFPIFIVEVLPTGLKGLIVAGTFAAAISSLDSILAALSQTTLSAFWLPRHGADEARALRVSKLLVLGFGVLLCLMAAFCEVIQRDPRFGAVLDLALAMPGYTQGALLAAFALAFWFRGRVDGSGFQWSAPLSVLMVVAVAWHSDWTVVALALAAAGLIVAWIAVHARAAPAGVARLVWRSSVGAAGLALVASVQATGFTTAWPWYVPIGSTTAFVFGYLLAERAKEVTA